MVGDLNADISDNKSLFGKCLLNFCNDNNLILASKSLLPEKSYTYISEAWHTVSWLDHCICTADAYASLVKLNICYELATSDHIPFLLTLNAENIPVLSEDHVKSFSGRLDWLKLSEREINQCSSQQNTESCPAVVNESDLYANLE